MSRNINKIFKAIADPTRREIFHILVLASTALSISQISDHFSMSRQAVTKHIKYLEGAGLVEIKDVGRERFCHANAIPLKEINDWVAFYEKFWDDKLSRLVNHLQQKADQKS
ncbi:MAG: helix-turn-helix transcriptional regulator [Cyclobacteriaceae bacterium]|nr:helix-turn-helix transcriptional regulator [Cyclobacteriaceae bacterium SS2]